MGIYNCNIFSDTLTELVFNINNQKTTMNNVTFNGKQYSTELNVY